MLPTDFMQMFYLKRQNSPLLLVHYHKWMLSFIKCSCLMFLSFLILFFLIQNVFIGMVSHSSWYRMLLVLLPSERASFCKPCFSSCRLAEDNRAANTQNYCLCMAKDGGDFIASWAFYIHEIGIGALHQALLVFPLLLFWRGMKKIFCERHVLVRRSSPPERLIPDFNNFCLPSFLI